jgi:predicted HNH restriction endonuclease
MQHWRWDQGRFGYFRFEGIKSIAKVLAKLDGVSLNTRADLLRIELEQQTGLPFSPERYKVWRNYKRVFSVSLLATEKSGKLVTTGICQWLAEGNQVDVDEYLSLLISRFTFPSPAFEDFGTEESKFYFCAALKFLLAAYETGKEQSLNLDEVASYIVGNNCTGREDLRFYQSLKPSSFRFDKEDEKRQVRESLIFISQLSFLKWHKRRLYLDILPGDTESIRALRSIAEPEILNLSSNRSDAILTLGAYRKKGTTPNTSRRQPADVTFTEGKKVRVTHLRIERSPYLREAFFSGLEKPFGCDMCGCYPIRIYPWTDNILEIHHLLPLSSTLDITGEGTSLKDIVALCPNCHRSVHTYYKQWLNQTNQDDFSSKVQAVNVYREAKGKVSYP